MNKVPLLYVTMAVVLVGFFCVLVRVERVRAIGPITITAEGPVDPPTAPINWIGDTYIFTDDILIDSERGIDVQRDNITIDGDGHILEGFNSSTGIDIWFRKNVTVRNLNIESFNVAGIQLVSSTHCRFFANQIKSCKWSIFVSGSSNNNISGNTLKENFGDGGGLWIEKTSLNNHISQNEIVDNKRGILLDSGPSHNNVSENHIINNADGIILASSSNNWFYENRFMFNTMQASAADSVNNWDNYIRGNYWTDYEARYPDAKEVDDLGIWDTPYVIDANNKDYRPLILTMPETIRIDDLDVGAVIAEDLVEPVISEESATVRITVTNDNLTVADKYNLTLLYDGKPLMDAPLLNRTLEPEASETLSHTLAADTLTVGSHTIGARATILHEGEVFMDQISTPFIVIGTPTLTVDGPASALTGQTVTFDASQSVHNDPNGVIQNYTWLLWAPGEAQAAFEYRGVRMDHTFDQAAKNGTWLVILTVEDNFELEYDDERPATAPYQKEVQLEVGTADSPTIFTLENIAVLAVIASIIAIVIVYLRRRSS